jgi:hypothetical protein
MAGTRATKRLHTRRTAAAASGVKPRAKGVTRRGTSASGGGLIAIGGPPLGGKSVLAAYLADSLPYAIKIETIDDLSRQRAYWLPEGPGGRLAFVGTGAILQRAKELWRLQRPGEAPVILAVARFGTSTERLRAKAAARAVGMRFLFVEARSRDERALRRIPMSFLSHDELRLRLARYEAALRSYVPVSGAEAALLPAVRLNRVQADLQAAVDRILRVW